MYYVYILWKSLHCLDAKLTWNFLCFSCVGSLVRVRLQELHCRWLVKNWSTLWGGLWFQWWQWAWIRGTDLVSCCCHIVSASSLLFPPHCLLFSSDLLAVLEKRTNPDFGLIININHERDVEVNIWNRNWNSNYSKLKLTNDHILSFIQRFRHSISSCIDDSQIQNFSLCDILFDISLIWPFPIGASDIITF